MQKKFHIGQKVIWVTDDRLDGHNEYEGTVKEVHDDHIIVDIPQFNDHCWFDTEDYEYLKAL